jgi:glycosyltransferase involved in cell wall biosynthesis
MRADDSVAVVIPAWRSRATIDLVLQSLVGQLQPDDEVVIVESSGSGEAAALQQSWPTVRVVAQEGRTRPGRARHIGASSTSAPLIAFLDADAVPDDNWLRELRGGLGSSDMVGGSVRNGTPDSAVGTAGYLLEFLRWQPDAAPPDSLVSCNLLVRREAYEALGGMPADIWPGEDTVFTYPLVHDGRAAFVSTASVTHLNRITMRSFLSHQQLLGQSFASVCAHGAYRHAAFGKRWLAPLSGLLRWAVTMRRTAGRRDGATRAIALRLILTLGLLAWTTGVLRGPNRAND